ncbi:dcmp deaminase [Ceraceosorus bombacis]|uniref:Deoxycytidylate deaminase n=1 Tax=Ceraceosorus bombacis TaxID=401625 RepID=A0A0N7L9B7_9BASI|nr:dcmp deaminase [Ceraceosorus bombacis]
MLIALIGPTFSGKTTVARYLIQRHAFTPVTVTDACCRPSPLESPSSSQSLAEAASNLDVDEAVGSLSFRSHADLLTHVTSHWRQNFVTKDLRCMEDISLGFDKRPFFLLVAIDASLFARAERARCWSGQDAFDWSKFAAEDHEEMHGISRQAREPKGHAPIALSKSTSTISNDGVSLVAQEALPSQSVARLVNGASGAAAMSGAEHSLWSLMNTAQVRVQNSRANLASLYAHLDDLDLVNAARLRPPWDSYFLSLCTLASLRSNCMKRRVGAVLVRSNRVLSTGYNGTAIGLLNCNQGGCPRCNGGAQGGTRLDECLCLHAEENALLECGRERGGAEGTVLYCNTCPCLRCAVKIVQVGVKEVVYELAYSMDDRSREIFRNAGVKFRQCHP